MARYDTLVDGLEAPRNSLELLAGTSHSYWSTTDELYPWQIEENWSERKLSPFEASIKRLIQEEMSKQCNARKNEPSLVARLMGVDTLPLEKKCGGQTLETNWESKETKLLKKEKHMISHLSSDSNSFRQLEFDSLYHLKDGKTDRWRDDHTIERPKKREHPQEEELQKFKKKFEAWQAARFREFSKVVENGNLPAPSIEQKVDHYGHSKTLKNERTVVDHDKFSIKSQSHERGKVQHRRSKTEILASDQEFFSVKNRTESRSFEQYSLHQEEQYSAPTRIVILRPGPDRINDREECWTSSTGTFDERGSIEDFLDEVKERLKLELQGKTLRKSSVVRGSGIETPISETPISDPKKIAKHIAKHVRDSVTHDLGINLVRSESTRSYGSKFQFHGPGSPNYINRNTRRILSEKNDIKRGLPPDVPLMSSESYLLANENFRPRQPADASKARNEHSRWEIVREDEIQTHSFGGGGDDYGVIIDREMSPRNLVRSFSAPVSGTSFGKLLLEDRHIVTGAHIRRKHERLENVTVKIKKGKKERFSIKEKVSNFKYSFTLTGRLFSRKLQSMVVSHGPQDDLVKQINNRLAPAPVPSMNFADKFIMENFTEVPPSPASVCSSTNDEFWRPTEYVSPMSTPEITFGEDSAVPHIFKEISSNLNELRRQLNALGSNEPEASNAKEEPADNALVDLEDKTEAFVRDVLVASGLYCGSPDMFLLRLDPTTNPISNLVLEEVEKSWRKLDKDYENAINKKVDCRMLFDILNEVLSSMLGPPVTNSRFRREIIPIPMVPPLRGKKLLDHVWDIICKKYMHPQREGHMSDYLLPCTTAIESSAWSGLMANEVNSLGCYLQNEILEDLIAEVFKDMKK